MAMEFMFKDCQSLLEQVNLQEKEFRHKRRWLIGLASESGSLKGRKFPSDSCRTIPECLLREDDVSYETMRSFIENGCKAKSKHRVLEVDMQLIRSPTDVKGLYSLIDNMTNEGLSRFAELLTGGSVEFEKTRWRMKQAIKGRLKESNGELLILSESHSSLLKNPRNFRWCSESRFIPDSESYQTAIVKMLDLLEYLPIPTLMAVHRKLRGIKGHIPRLIPKRSGWRRDAFIEILRKRCLMMLSKDPLSEPLASGMEVAGLTLKLIQGCKYVTNFKRFPPEVSALQNEIATCIPLLERVKLSVLKDIKAAVDPKVKVSKWSLRTSLRNWLAECLLEIGDMETVPDGLLEALAIIKRSSERSTSKHISETNKEIECVLSLSACMKQLVWDLIPGDDLDVEFADAYMEDLEDSDGELEAQHVRSSEEQVGSSGEMEIKSADSCSQVVDKDAMWYHLVSLRNVERERASGSVSYEERSNNGYLGVQGASDETSMVAYRLIGRILYDFAQTEGCKLNSSDVYYLGVGAARIEAQEDGCSKVLL